MPKFVRFTDPYDKKSVLVNPDLVILVKEAGDYYGQPVTYITFYGECRTVEGSTAEVIEKLEDARRG